MNKPRELVGPVNLRNWKAVGLIFLVLMGSLFVIDSALKTVGSPSPIFNLDPIKPLWYDSLPQDNLNHWNTRGFIVSFDAGNGWIKMASNATASAIAISTQAMDLTPAIAKTLELWQKFQYEATSGTQGQFAFFITRNATVPTFGEDLDWDPNSDLDVVWILRQITTYSGGSGLVTFVEYHQINPTRTISQDDAGCQVGSVYLCANLKYSTSSAYMMVNSLNFTARAAGANPSQMTIHNSTTVTALQTNSRLPGISLGPTRYYWGLWVKEKTGGVDNNLRFSVSPDVPDPATCGFCGTAWATNDSMMAAIYFPPTVTGQLEPPGLWGNLQRSLGGVAEVLGRVWSTFNTGLKDAFNSVGRFLGLGALGDILGSAFTTFNSLVTLFGDLVFAQLANLYSFLNIGWTFVTTLVGSLFTNITAFFTSLFGLLGIVFTVFGFLFLVFPVGYNAAGIFLVGDMSLWVVWNYQNGWDGTRRWLDMNEYILLKFFRFIFWAVEKIAQFLFWLISVIQNAISSVPIPVG